MLSETDLAFLQRRRQGLRWLRVATIALPLIWLLGVAFACLRFPALVDPTGVASELAGGHPDWALIRALARMAPVLFLMLLGLVTFVLVGFLRMLHRERRLLEIARRLQG